MFLDRAAEITDSQLLDPEVEVEGAQEFRKKRLRIIGDHQKVVRKITALIHSRMAFSVSVFVLVILAAALGIIFRGAHVLTAFGISFVPSLLVIVTIIMGRQMAQNEGTIGTVGVYTIWAGIALVAAMDVWTLTRALRR